jgi:hypothetical protein
MYALIEATANDIKAAHGNSLVYNYKTVAKILAKSESALLQMKYEGRLHLPIVPYGARSWGATPYAIAAYLHGHYAPPDKGDNRESMRKELEHRREIHPPEHQSQKRQLSL